MPLLINVYGTERSGSTMLDLILGNDPKGFSLGEVANWFYPTRSHHFDIKCACGVYPCPVWEKIKDIDKDIFHEKLFEILNVDFLVDSSKFLPWVVDNNYRGRRRKTFKVKNVLIYKSPLSYYYSLWKRGKTDIDAAFLTYCNDYEFFFHTGLEFVVVFYDEFVNRPKETIEKLCNILEIPFFDEKIFFAQKTHHHLFGSFGTRRQLFSDKQTIYKPNFSDSFRKLIPDIEKQLKSNKRLVQVLSKLESMDVFNIDSYPPERGPKFTSWKMKLKLYYRPKLRKYLKRYKPEHYPDKESMFIKDYRF